MSTHLKEFAKNRRKKEKTDVLTARLPESLYTEFKGYCEGLDLTISEAICLLVKYELANGMDSSVSEVASSNEYTMNQNANHNEIVIDSKSNTKSKTNRFTTTQWQVDGQLPCPYCGLWVNASNFSRHAKQHVTTTQDIFMNENFREKINAMIQAKKAEINEEVNL
jgi:hypothetical protein